MKSKNHLRISGIWIIWTITAVLISDVNSEYYSSISGMEEIVEAEGTVIKFINHIISSTESNLLNIKKHAAQFRGNNKKINENITEHLASPVNIYLLTKRLFIDWEKIFSLITDLNNEINHTLSHIRENVALPTEDDLQGAATGLMRIQELYQLDAASMADGILNGIKYRAHLSANDCFELAKQFYNFNENYYAEEWMKTALEKFDEKTSVFEHWEGLEYLSYIAYRQGNLSKTLELLDKILDEVPNQERVLKNRDVVKAEINKAREIKHSLNKIHLNLCNRKYWGLTPKTFEKISHFLISFGLS